MSIDTFIQHFAEAIETDAGTLAPATVFKDLANWDSLAALSVIAMIDEYHGIAIGGADLEQAATLQDLWNLVAQRRA